MENYDDTESIVIGTRTPNGGSSMKDLTAAPTELVWGATRPTPVVSEWGVKLWAAKDESICLRYHVTYGHTLITARPYALVFLTDEEAYDLAKALQWGREQL
jgi:hypothetical protein